MHNDKFNELWQKTEILRGYDPMLHTFGDTVLAYLMVSAHPEMQDRSVVCRGIIVLEKPHILLPGQVGPEFTEGFDAEEMPSEAMYIFRAMRLPYSRVSNKVAAEQGIEYGTLQAVLDKFYEELDSRNDRTTGLIKAEPGGGSISLMCYAVSQMIKSAPDNVNHFFEHIRRQSGAPIQADDQITDEDISRLFNS